MASASQLFEKYAAGGRSYLGAMLDKAIAAANKQLSPAQIKALPPLRVEPHPHLRQVPHGGNLSLNSGAAPLRPAAGRGSLSLPPPQAATAVAPSAGGITPPPPGPSAFAGGLVPPPTGSLPRTPNFMRAPLGEAATPATPPIGPAARPRTFRAEERAIPLAGTALRVGAVGAGGLGLHAVATGAPSGGAANLGPSLGTAKSPGTGQNTAAYYSRFRPSRQDAPDTGEAKPGPGVESAGLARGGPGPGASDSQTPGGTTDQILSFLKSYGLPIGLGVGGLGLLGYAMSGNKDDEEEEDGVVPRRRKAAAFPLGGYAGLAQILKARHTNPAPATPVGAQIDRFIGEHPFVTGFLLKCADAKLDDAQIREAILAAKRVSPSVAQVFTGSRL